MAVLSKKLKCKNSSGTTENITLYSTTSEIGGSSNFVALKVDGVTAYARAGAIDTHSSSIHTKKSGTTYRVAKKSVFTVTINQSDYQTITVSCNGNNYTSTFTAPYGSTYTASISASSNYTPGTLSSTSGTITDDVTISATAATYVSPGPVQCGCR